MTWKSLASWWPCPLCGSESAGAPVPPFPMPQHHPCLPEGRARGGIFEGGPQLVQNRQMRPASEPRRHARASPYLELVFAGHIECTNLQQLHRLT